MSQLLLDDMHDVDDAKLGGDDKELSSPELETGETELEGTVRSIENNSI